MRSGLGSHTASRVCTGTDPNVLPVTWAFMEVVLDHLRDMSCYGFAGVDNPHFCFDTGKTAMPYSGARQTLRAVNEAVKNA